MATRKPDGLEEQTEIDNSGGRGEARWERDRGDPAARPAGDARAMGHVVRAGESFPYLADALAGKGDDEKVKILNLSLRSHQYDTWDIIDEAGKIEKLQKPRRVKMGPFAVREVTVRTARAQMKRHARPAVRRAPLTVIVLHAKEGDCKRERSFVYNGQTFQSCPFERCAQHGHATKPWSIHRAQQFLITLRTPQAIQRFVEKYDPRPEVALFATAEIRAREQAIARNRLGGLQPQAQNDAVI